MIKISQLPDVDNYKGDEVLPVVQNGSTRKAKAVFVDKENKIKIPMNVELIAKGAATEIKLLSAKVVDGIPTLFVGDDAMALYKGDSMIVTEKVMQDGGAYVRINNAWAKRDPITQINDRVPTSGGGKIDLSAGDVGAHVSNKANDGKPYVSTNGLWTSLESGVDPLISQKANVTHTHAQSDIIGLQGRLSTIDAKMATLVLNVFAKVSHSGFTSTANKGIVTSDKQLLRGTRYEDNVITIDTDGDYMFVLSGKGNVGTLSVTIDDIDQPMLKADVDGMFNQIDAIRLTAGQKVKLNYETSSQLSMSYVLAIHTI